MARENSSSAAREEARPVCGPGLAHTPRRHLQPPCARWCGGKHSPGGAGGDGSFGGAGSFGGGGSFGGEGSGGSEGGGGSCGGGSGIQTGRGGGTYTPTTGPEGQAAGGVPGSAGGGGMTGAGATTGAGAGALSGRATTGAGAGLLSGRLTTGEGAAAATVAGASLEARTAVERCDWGEPLKSAMPRAVPAPMRPIRPAPTISLSMGFRVAAGVMSSVGRS